MGISDRERKDLNTMCSSANAVKLGNIIDKLKSFPIPEGTPANAEAAEGEITIESGNAQNKDELTIGDVTYTFVSELSDPAEVNEVKIGADNDATASNLVKAVMAGDDEGTAYSTGTEENPKVTAEAGAGDNANNITTITAKVKGESGNNITYEFIPETDGTENISLNPEETLEEGVDGTEGKQFQQYVDANYIYVAAADTTVSDSNWKRISLSTY